MGRWNCRTLLDTDWKIGEGGRNGGEVFGQNIYRYDLGEEMAIV